MPFIGNIRNSPCEAKFGAIRVSYMIFGSGGGGGGGDASAKHGD